MMAATNFQFGFLSLMVVISTVLCDVEKRTIVTKFWPDCGENNTYCEEAKQKGWNLVYSKASPPKTHDNLHYVFSTISLPTVLLARTTGVDVDMHFDWSKLLPDSNQSTDAITFVQSNPKDLKDKFNVDYKFAMTFTKLIEYDDKGDSADLRTSEKKLSKNEWKLRPFGNFTWMNVTGDEKSNTVVFNTSIYNNKTDEDGSISFTFSLHEKDGRSTELPSLKYGVNETQFDFLISNYTPSFNHSRFALEVVLVSLSGNKDMKVESTDSIDDEYSPGVFEIVNWLSNPAKKAVSGFLQWKPVSYLSKDRDRKTATKVLHYKLQDVNINEDEELNLSLIPIFIGNLSENTYIMKSTNISFGLPKDGFYLKNNYTVWSAAVGYGTPPTDSISATVIIIISAGLGLPVVIIIFGGLYTCIRKMRRGSPDYEPINSGRVN